LTISFCKVDEKNLTTQSKAKKKDSDGKGAGDKQLDEGQKNKKSKK
jgi:hypothetical protein